MTASGTSSNLSWACSPLLLALGGCAAVGETVKQGADLMFGSAPPPPEIIETATKFLPEPWGTVAGAVGGALVGVWGYLYRRRLLKTDPAKVD